MFNIQHHSITCIPSTRDTNLIHYSIKCLLFLGGMGGGGGEEEGGGVVMLQNDQYKIWRTKQAL